MQCPYQLAGRADAGILDTVRWVREVPALHVRDGRRLFSRTGYDDAYYVATTRSLEVIIGRWQKKSWSPQGLHPRKRPDTAPYLWLPEKRVPEVAEKYDALPPIRCHSLDTLYNGMLKLCRPFGTGIGYDVGQCTPRNTSLTAPDARKPAGCQDGWESAPGVGETAEHERGTAQVKGSREETRYVW